MNFGDGSTTQGKGIPQRLNHTYRDVGAFSLNVSIAGWLGSVPLEVEPLRLLQNVSLACEHCNPLVPLPQACVGWQLGLQGYDCAWFPLSSLLVGKQFSINDTLSLHGLDYAFMQTCTPDPTAKPIQVFDGTHEEGTVPAGAGCIVIWEGGTAVLADADQLQITFE